LDNEHGHSNEFPTILQFWIGLSERLGLLSAWMLK